MANEQGLLKQTVFAKQTSGLGGSGASPKIKRRTSSVFTKNVDTYESNEIVSHQQSTGANAGIVKTSGKLDGLISPGTFSEQFASLLRKDLAATTAMPSLTLSVATSGSNYSVTRSAGSWLTDGVKVGDILRLTGSLNAANAGRNLIVMAVSSGTVMVVRRLDGVAMNTSDSNVAGCTATVIGKKTWVPTSGHTNDYWSVEEWYSGLGLSELFKDCKIAKADVTIPATGNATVSFDVPGLSRTEGVAQVLTSPAAETTTNVLTAVNGMVLVNGTATAITGAQLTIDGHIQPGEAEVGTNGIGDHIRGEISVSGQFTAKFSSTVLQQFYTSQSLFTLVLVLTDSNQPTSDFVTFVLPQCKLFGDAPDDGEAKEIIRTYPFTAQIPSATFGGPSLQHNQTIISVQDSQAP